MSEILAAAIKSGTHDSQGNDLRDPGNNRQNLWQAMQATIDAQEAHIQSLKTSLDVLVALIRERSEDSEDDEPRPRDKKAL
jgi:hypothetical protein